MVMQMFAWDRNPGPRGAARVSRSRHRQASQSMPGVEPVGAVQAMPFIESNIDIQGAVRLRRSAGAAARRGDPRVDTTSPRRAISR